MTREYILAINPGSTSTKVAIFKGGENLLQKNLSHSAEEVAKLRRVTDQYEYRQLMILDWMKEVGISTESLSAVVGRYCSSVRIAGSPEKIFGTCFKH